MLVARALATGVVVSGLALPVASGAQNTPPVADAGPDLVLEPTEPGELQGSASDPDGDSITSWQWAVESAPAGSNPLFSHTNVPNPNFSGDLEGDYLLSLVVSDGTDTSEPDFVTVTVVANQPPVAVAEADVTSGPAPLTVQFDASASFDPEGSDLAYIWRFQDGSAVNSDASPTHTFDSAGYYDVTLSVVDDLGQVGLDTVVITAEEPAAPVPLLSGPLRLLAALALCLCAVGRRGAGPVKPASAPGLSPGSRGRRR